MAKKKSDVENSLSSVVGNLSRANIVGTQVNQTTTLYKNNRNYLVSNDRTVLSWLYAEHGLIQTLVDQPVDDAFRTGFEIRTAQLSAEEIEQLNLYLKQNEVIGKIVEVGQWGRLFGGGSLLINTNQDFSKPFHPATLKEFSDLEFIATDMWELYSSTQGIQEGVVGGKGALDFVDGNYSYYGYPVHPSRVLPFKGKQAPSFIRRQLRGWGMSEVERIVTSFNQYLKNNNVIFELLDEAKVDIYKIEGLNSALLSSDGSAKVTNRVQTANQLKNFLSALVMDTQDDYEQKQITFSGLSEVLTQIRQGIASDLKMPITKLFGVSSAGFSSGEDDIENYNSMIESQVRLKMEPIVMQVIQIVSQKLFGTMLDDLEIEWGSLRVLGAEQEENVKNFKFNRTMVAFQNGLIDAQIAKESINKDNLLPIDIPEDDNVFETGLEIDDIVEPIASKESNKLTI